MFGQRTAKALVAAALLLAIAGAMVGEYVHTDDGCRVEIHCLACRLAVGTTAVSGAPLPSTPTLAHDGSVVALAQRPGEAPHTPTGPSRGPPHS
jgi:hypothetical protein